MDCDREREGEGFTGEREGGAYDCDKKRERVGFKRKGIGVNMTA